jgi:hypothetical protein
MAIKDQVATPLDLIQMQMRRTDMDDRHRIVTAI